MVIDSDYRILISDRTRGLAMATRQSKPQKETIGRVMHEFKQGELETRDGRKVKNPKQAVAIGLREAGASKYQSRAKNQENLKRTKRRERSRETAKHTKEPRRREPTREELYAEARRRNIPGRSKMGKQELMHAVRRS
jgi:hypothetical protein